MKDKGKIVALQGNYAQVELNCLYGCAKCSACHICSNKEPEKGLIQVRNPIQAGTGDEVVIYVPEEKYTRALIKLFGLLVLASVSGMFVGYYIAPFLSFSPSAGGVLGLLLGLAGTGFVLFCSFRKNKTRLYPEIIDIIKKGDHHE